MYSTIRLLLVSLLIATSGLGFAQSGKVTGGEKYHMPGWFKPSFMDFQEDNKDALAAGKNLVVFLHMDECPYCAKVIKESLTDGPVKDYMQAHFDFVGWNIKGNLDMTWVDGSSDTEAGVARKMGLFATPTLFFIGPENQVLLQLMGYRPSNVIQAAGEFVSGGHFKTTDFKTWLAARSAKAYQPVMHPLLQDKTDWGKEKGALAVLFEGPDCEQCQRMQEKTWQHPKVMGILKRMQFTRMLSTDQRDWTLPDGKTMKPADWIRELKIQQFPAVVLYAEGKIVSRVSTAIYKQHLSEALAYVADGAYKNMTIREFKDRYRSDQMARGENVDYSE